MANEQAEAYAKSPVASAWAARKAFETLAIRWLTAAVINLGRAVQEIDKQQDSRVDDHEHYHGRHPLEGS